MTLFSLRIWRTTLVVARNTETSRGFGVFTAMLRKEDVASMRRNYEMPDGFDESHLVAKEPVMQFDAWFREASKSPNIGEANAMILSTCGRFVVIFFSSFQLLLMYSFASPGTSYMASLL